MKVVLDTNILVSAFAFPGGSPEAVYRLALEERIELVASPALLAELGRVLQEKIGWSPERAEDAVGQIVRIASIVRPREVPKVIDEDPDDNAVLAAARSGRAELIVSGDAHLLDLGSWQGIMIERAAEALARLG